MQTVESFVGALRRNSGTTNAHMLRHARFCPYEDADIRDACSYILCSGGGLSENHDVGYIVSVIYMIGHRSPEQENGTISFQKLLRDLYLTSSKTMKDEIKTFITTEIDETGKFWRSFFHFLNMNSLNIKNINCIELAKDLLQWNTNGNVRIKWAKTLIS